MRLIDADSLKDDGCNYVWAETIGFGMAKKEYRFVNRIQIDNASTVEAIPIEWLEKKAQEFAERYWNKKDDHKKLILPMADCPVVIEQMIKEWRVENEIN